MGGGREVEGVLGGWADGCVLGGEWVRQSGEGMFEGVGLMS